MAEELSLTELRKLRNRQKAEQERIQREEAQKLSSGLQVTKESLKNVAPTTQISPRISAGGEDIKSAVGGTKTISQEKRDYFRNLDVGNLTPFQISTMGGRDAIEKAIEEAKKPSDAEVAGAKKTQPSKPAPKTERKQAPQKPDESLRVWRVLRKDGTSTAGEFYDTKEQAEAALQKIGGTSVGAVAGIKFPGKTREESTRMRDEYMQRSLERPAQVPQNEEGVLRDKLARLGASKEQQDRYMQTLYSGRAKREEREAEYKKGGEKFWTELAAKRSATDQINIYNRQMGGLRRAYNAARKSGDELTALQIGNAIEEAQIGVPSEVGAMKRAAEKGQIQRANEMIARERERIAKEIEEKKKKESLKKSNPDAAQYSDAGNFVPQNLGMRNEFSQRSFTL